MSAQPLFTPVRMGDLDLPNRIVMAPLTRMRAGPIDHVPTALTRGLAVHPGDALCRAAESFLATLSMVP
jgi:hypothetical protein